MIQEPKIVLRKALLHKYKYKYIFKLVHDHCKKADVTKRGWKMYYITSFIKRNNLNHLLFTLLWPHIPTYIQS